MAARTSKTATKTVAKAAAKPKAATTRKKTTKAKTAAVAPKAPPAPTPKVVETVKPKVTSAPIKKPELIDRVVTATGMKKKDVKPVVEAMLAVLGDALAAGEDMTVPPLGKVMLKNTKDLSNAKVMNIKIRRKQAMSRAGKDPLAAAAE